METSRAEPASGWITFSLLMTVQLIRRQHARAKPALKSLFTLKTAVKAKRSKPAWRTGSPRSNRSTGGPDRQITWVILLDSDGQHLPEEIDRFMASAASVTRPTFFIGNRMNNVTGMPFMRRVVNRYMSKEISRVCGQQIPDTQCGFRMLDRQLASHLRGGGHRYDYETEALIIASRTGYQIESVPITTVYTDQVSKIHPVRDAFRFFKLMRRYRKP